MKRFILNGVHSCISFYFNFIYFLLLSFLPLLSTTLHLYINQSGHHICMDCITFHNNYIPFLQRQSRPLSLKTFLA